MVQTELSDFGPYRIQELLGQGGMGVVHRAYDTVHDRVIALKRLPASVTERDFRARFRRESRIAAGLSHPNVIPVNDFGEIDGQLYLDMMLVDGVDLRRALGTGVVDFTSAIGILTQVAHALDAAHAGGLVHRDVKPSNILIDDAGHVYLADFGIARETGPDGTRVTRSGALVGSWDYMAPERFNGGHVDGRADQYSLACVLFECLTGRLPYPIVEPAAKIAGHLLHPPPAPSLFVPTITPALDAVIQRGLAKDPARRFPTPTAMMAAAESAAYAGVTARSPAPTAPGPAKERDQDRLIRAILRSTAGREPAPRPDTDTPPACPYPGLRGFDSADADWFHGRDHVVTDLLVRLAEQLDTGEPVVVVGASGAGKSSVLRAGLLPALAPADWPRVVLTPGVDPIGILATALAPHTGGTATECARVIRETPERFGAQCVLGAGADPSRPVIVVDQFEELFTHGISQADRVAFATALANAHPALVVLAVRADLVERCIELAPLIPALAAPVLLGAMDATELRTVIVAPARDAGIEVEAGLADRLIGDLGNDPGALPRLAHALRETWNHRDGTMLTLAAYRRAGGIDGAVARTAEEIYAWLDPPGRQVLRALLLRLVAVLDDGAVARRRVDPAELTASWWHQRILDHLIAARLVTVDGTGARLAHEALLTAWPRLRDWIDEDRAGLIQHRRFADAVRVWDESARHADYLYRGTRLAVLTSWLDSARDRVRLHPAEQEFLARSTAAEQAGQLATRRRTRRLRVLVAALSALLVLAGVATVVATRLGQDARAERSRADAEAKRNLSRQLAAESALALDPRRAALAALGAWQTAPTVEARSAVLATQSDFYRGRLNGHVGDVNSVTVSADGRVAASGGADGTLRLWDLPNRRQLTILHDSEDQLRRVSMSTDGKLLTAADYATDEVTLWSVPDRKRLFTVPEPAADTAISPDGKTFLAHVGDEITVWDTKTLTALGRFPGPLTLSMNYSKDGSMVAMTNDDTVEVYRVPDGMKVATLTGHTGRVTSAAFNPAGTMLASSSQDGTVRLWDTQSWAEDRVLSPAGGSPDTVEFSPSGDAVLAGGALEDINVWDPATGAVLINVRTGNTVTPDLAMTGDGHTLLGADVDGHITVWAFRRSLLGTWDSSVIGVAAQPGGPLLATTSANGSVRLWDSTTGDLVRHLAGHDGAAAVGAAFSPDGARLVTSGDDGTVILWDTATGAELHSYDRPGTAMSAVAFSPKGTMIAVGGYAPPGSGADRDEVLLLDATDLSLLQRRPTKDLPRNPQQEDVDLNYPAAVAFSPDSGTLALALSGGQIALWNLSDRDSEMTMLAGHDDTALDVEFRFDGKVLVTAGSDGQARLWRVSDGRQLGTFGHDQAVRRATFSPDGATLATATLDTVVRTWDVRTREPLTRLDRHVDELNDVEFTSTGTVIASASTDGMTRVWNLDVDQAVRTLCGLLDPATMAEEWRALGPGRGDPPTCPDQ